MESAPTIDTFCQRPVNRWVAAGSSVVFCFSDELLGCVLWGNPSAEEATETLRAFDALRHGDIAPRFNLLVDASRLEGMSGAAEGLLAQWVLDRRADLLKRVRLQALIESAKVPASKFRELAAALGELPLYRAVKTLREAAALVLPQSADFPMQLDAIAEGSLVVPTEVRRLRQYLAHDTSATLDQAARALGLSARGLNRTMTEVGSNFHDEVKAARFRKACYLLEETDDDPMAIANAVGLNEPSLNQLFKEKARITPSDYRDRARSQL